MPAYRDLLGGGGATITKGRVRKHTLITSEKLAEYENQAIAIIANRWAEFIEGKANFIHPDITDGKALYYFIQAKYRGDAYPRWCSLAFTPSQIRTAGHKDGGGSFLRLLKLVGAGQPSEIRGFRFATEDASSFLQFVSTGIGIRSHRLPLDFPAGKAAQIIDEFCPVGGTVLDPCHGWGGRVTGFLLANNPSRYVGVDPNKLANVGVKNIVSTFAPFAEPQKTTKFVLSPFEEFETKERFDLVFTCPPYFDVEKYEGEKSSWKQYNNFEAWRDNFYWLLFANSCWFVKDGGYCAFVVGSQKYPLLDVGKRYAKKVGLTLIKTERFLANHFVKTSSERGETLIVFKKEK